MPTVLLIILFALPSMAQSKPQDLPLRVGLKTGSYNLIQGKEDKCQGSLVEIQWEIDELQALLRIGDRFLLPNLDKTQAIEELPIGCTDKTINRISKEMIEQTLQRTCKDKKSSFEQIQKIEFNKETVTYSLEKSALKKTNLVCQYKLASAKEVSK